MSTGSSGQIRITWENPPRENFSYLRIYRNTAAALGSLVAPRVSGASYTDQGLEDGVTYYYAVRTVDSSGTEHPDAVLANAAPFARTRGSVPPPPVTSLSALDLGDGTIKLSWKNPAPHVYASISIYRSAEPSGRGDLFVMLFSIIAFAAQFTGSASPAPERTQTRARRALQHALLWETDLIRTQTACRTRGSAATASTRA